MQVSRERLRSTPRCGVWRLKSTCTLSRPGIPSGGASGELQTPTTDSISVVDTTLGTAIADFSVNRTIDDHVELLANGSAVSTLTLTYTNNNWWGYDVFSTTLVPPGAELAAAHNV